MGISSKAPKGVVVTSVEPYSAAAAAGLEPGDIITEAAGQPVDSKEALEKTLATMDRERGTLLLIQRADSSTFAILKF